MITLHSGAEVIISWEPLVPSNDYRVNNFFGTFSENCGNFFVYLRLKLMSVF
jgi:hypothetical protein